MAGTGQFHCLFEAGCANDLVRSLLRELRTVIMRRFSSRGKAQEDAILRERAGVVGRAHNNMLDCFDTMKRSTQK